MSGEDKDQKMEEARKRVEELKKKNQLKKKRKNKQENATKQDPPSASGSEVTDGVTSPNGLESDESVRETKSPESMQVKNTEEAAIAPEIPTEEAAGEDKSEGDNSADIKPENPTDTHRTEEAAVEEDHIKTNSTLNDAVTHNSEHESEVKAYDTYPEEASPPPPASEELFGQYENTNNEFMSTIIGTEETDPVLLQKEISSLREELGKLNNLYSDQGYIINKLESELKEKNDNVTRLTEELSQLKLRLAEAEEELSHRRSTNNQPPSALHFSRFTTSLHEENKQNREPPGIIDESFFEKWKHWNVDMTSWRSVGAGPIVEF